VVGFGDSVGDADVEGVSDGVGEVAEVQAPKLRIKIPTSSKAKNFPFFIFPPFKNCFYFPKLF
jgi:hypothetical protein